MKIFWKYIHKKYGYNYCRIFCPIGILGKVNSKGKWVYRYIIHNQEGKCICGQASLFSAIKYVKSHPNTYLCKIWD